MIAQLARRITYLQNCCKLCLLAHSYSDGQAKYLRTLSVSESVDFSDPAVRSRALSCPAEFVRQLEKPAVLHNLQYVPELVPFLAAADVPNGSYIAAVTQLYPLLLLLKQYEEQIALIELPLQSDGSGEPFTPARYLQGDSAAAKNTDVLHEILLGRLLPDNGQVFSARQQQLSAWLKQFLQRDIMNLTPVSDDMKFYRFLCAVAAATSSIVNYANLGKAAGVTSPTAEQWAAYLDGAGLITYLRPLEHPALKRTAKAPKLYFRDTGLAAYLLHIGSAAELTQSVFFGALYETYVYNRIRESYLAAGERADLSYFRDSNAREISLLLREGGVLYPIDIVKDSFSAKKLLKKFKALEPLSAEGSVKPGLGGVISFGRQEKQAAAGLWHLDVENL